LLCFWYQVDLVALVPVSELECLLEESLSHDTAFDILSRSLSKSERNGVIFGNKTLLDSLYGRRKPFKNIHYKTKSYLKTVGPLMKSSIADVSSTVQNLMGVKRKGENMEAEGTLTR